MNEPSYRQVAGRRCLDFINTVRARITDADAKRTPDYADLVVDERLVSYAALLRWATLTGVVPERHARDLRRHASARPEEAASVLARSLAVRNALYRLFKATIEGWRPDGTDVTTFNRELRIARAHERLAASSRLRWEWDEPSALDRVLWPIVREAAVLLTGPDLDKVRQCPGTECGWLFYDASRSGRRQWCDMATCGNFAKVQRFRDRQRRARSAVLRTTSSSKMRRMQ
jgi:predicted RNA-binding Zn ribbon-like protein